MSLTTNNNLLIILGCVGLASAATLGKKMLSTSPNYYYWKCWTQNKISSVAPSFMIAQHDQGVSLSWIQKILRSNNIPNTDNLEIEITSGMQGGLMGSMVKVALKWPEGSDPTLPKGLVIKTMPSDPQRRLSTILLGSAREAIFYKKFAREFQEFGILPRVFAADGSFFSGDFVVVMEDLSPSTILCGRLLGNQCWGPAEIPPEFQQDPFVVFESIFLRMADVHAKFWRDQSLLSNEWMKYTNWLQGRDQGSWEFAMTNVKNRWGEIMAAIRSGSTTVKWSESLIQVMDNAIANTSWKQFHESFDIHNPTTPFTFCHGDFHANNVLWEGGDDKTFYLVDWPEVGVFCPFTEIAQFLVSNATIDIRRKHEKALFQSYWNRLVQKGVSADVFPLDDCWERYKAGGIERWLQMLALLALFNINHSNQLPDASVNWFHDQVNAFIEDHAFNCKRTISFMSVYCISS